MVPVGTEQLTWKASPCGIVRGGNVSLPDLLVIVADWKQYGEELSAEKVRFFFIKKDTLKIMKIKKYIFLQKDKKLA